MMGGRVLLAMSGGIDSSAAAVILMRQGYEVEGFTFKIKGVSSFSVDNAKSICKKLGIRHEYHDITEIFKRDVIEYFINEYENGRTPNPCVVCNRMIKFGHIYDHAMERGFDFAATGHYASIRISGGVPRLAKSIDSARDQSYFLYILKENQLRHILFPLDGLKKSGAREICGSMGLMSTESSESREICFIASDYKRFLESENRNDSKKGDFVDIGGRKLGVHGGISNFTIGQRKGLGITVGKPAYVVDINNESREVTLGGENDLYRDSFAIKDVNLINGYIPTGCDLYVKIRYGAAPARIKELTKRPDNGFLIKTEEPMRAVAPGQSAVIYEGDYVAGGGVIL
ncbi:MAG: tRNA 2-thiouridine(34) synthase MnmA [Clostridia bacterium]|nr:tRNA 2-thiouridine(34) synthase MnmA [Clostridia bacterium]